MPDQFPALSPLYKMKKKSLPVIHLHVESLKSLRKKEIILWGLGFDFTVLAVGFYAIGFDPVGLHLVRLLETFD